MRYAELHCKTNFSFLEGASHADELVARAVESGYAALAVTDRSTLSGVVRAHIAAKDAGLKLIVGAEISPVDAPPVVLWATDRTSYGRLARLITRGRRRAGKGECELTLDDVADHADGLLAGVAFPLHPERSLRARTDLETTVASESRPVLRTRPADLGEDGDHRTVISRSIPSGISIHRGPHLNALASYRELFGDRCYLLAELHRGPDDERRLARLMDLSRRSDVPLVAAGDVHYHVPGRMALHDVLTAVRHGTTVAAAGELLFPNAQRHIKPLDAIAAAFARAPQAIRRTVEIADRCTFSLDELRYEYPEHLAPQGLTPMEHLVRLTWQGANKRYPHGVPERVRGLLEHELTIIEQLHYEAYFLTVWDLVRLARSRGILCQGRGSAANSAVCYCLGITAVDPERTDVLFERFVSRQRNEAPDIDVDFEHERREEVLQYLYEKYGRDRAGLTAEVICYRTRSAVRDVGKALGLSLDRVDALAKNVEGYHHEPKLDQRCQQAGIDPNSPIGRRLVYLVHELVGFPRHLSQHVGGMVITQGPLCELVPIENAAMDGRTVIQWDKDDLDELGILKVDCLALGMLTAIRKCFALVKQYTGRELTLANVPEDDPAVYEMICRADTMGVFQIESRAQMSMLPRLQPRCFYDLVIEVAIVRPGPIQGNMVHPYLRRRSGQDPVTYPSDAIRDVLHKTLGVPIFQEQAMRLAVVAAGFTPGEADQLRRAMGAWRRPGVIDQFRRKLIDGMLARGLTEKFAEQVFQQIRGFGEYGFPESHAASFALLVYVSAWLKCHYHAAFTAAVINSQPMGFYAPAQLVHDARQHNVTVRPLDVNYSDWDCMLEVQDADEGGEAEGGKRRAESNTVKQWGQAPLANRFSPAIADVGREPVPFFHGPPALHPALRLGFRLIRGLSQVHAETIVAARRDGPFRSVDDFTRRTGLSRSVLTRLARADALKSLGRDRRSSLWEALAQEKQGRSLPLLAGLAAEDELPVTLPKMDAEEEVFADYQTAGLSLRAHPISFYRHELDRLHITPAGKLPTVGNNTLVRVAGLVLLRQRPSTAKGITFVTIEDETGTANLVIRAHVWQRYYQVARGSAAMIAHGKLESKHSVIHVVVHRLEDLSAQLQQLKQKTRDFR